jgi:hypothetical protein
VLGHSNAATHIEETALRYKYAAGLPEDVRISHYNTASYLTRTGGHWREVFGHRLAAAAISFVTGLGGSDSVVMDLVGDLRRAGDPTTSALPADFGALCATVEDVEGVRLRELMQNFVRDEDQLNAWLQEVIAKATSIAKATAAFATAKAIATASAAVQGQTDPPEVGRVHEQ